MKLAVLYTGLDFCWKGL